MKKRHALMTFVVAGSLAGGDATAQLQIRGSDTLWDVTEDVLLRCFLFQFTNYQAVNGGSDLGQLALQSGQQRIAPMARWFNGTACPGGGPTTNGTLDPRAEQLLIGFGAVAVVGANQAHRDSLFDVGLGQPFNCGDAVSGLTLSHALITPSGSTCTNDPALVPAPGPNCCLDATGANIANCNPDGSYTFASWKDVLALLYGGQNNSANDPLSAAFPKTRQINKINCASQVRKALADNWGDLFETDCSKGAVAGNCKKLKHAFRLGDLSDSSDTFVKLVGLVPIPPFTTTFQSPPIGSPTVNPLTATANPFCSAGVAPMNKGDSDYLDLDPIRRIADSRSAAFQRMGLEQVAEGYAVPSNEPPVLGVDTRPDPTPASALVELPEFGAPNRQNVGPNPAITAPAPNDFITLQRNALAQRKGLGLVLPIVIPAKYYFSGLDAVYWQVGQAAPTQCNPTVFAPTIPGSPPHGVCPDGSSGICLMPVWVNPIDPSDLNFNCLSNQAVPARPPTKDTRVYNLNVVDRLGHYVYDDYFNPAINLTAQRQARVVSGYFRLHATQSTNFGGTPTFTGTPGSGVCMSRTGIAQIGCLVKASPCSIGFASRQAVDKVTPFNNLAYGLGATAADSLAPTDTMIHFELLDISPGATPYPMAHGLFVNHWVDPALPAPPLAADQETLYGCFKNPAITNASLSAYNLVPGFVGPVVESACRNP